MSNTLTSDVRKARKPHRCSFCGHLIPIGETYRDERIQGDGSVWTWKMHLHCERIANAIWAYAHPDDDGMRQDEFLDTVTTVMRDFICPHHCTGHGYDPEKGRCASHPTSEACLKKFDAFMKAHRLKYVNSGNCPWGWRMEEVKDGEMLEKGSGVPPAR